MHFWSSGCYGFWCFPCFMCTTTGEFGESTCLPLLDIFGPAILATFGIPVCVPPVSLGMRVAVRHKYDIGVSFSLSFISETVNHRRLQNICLYVLQQGSICEDIMVTCCCIWCSWCQMSREIKARKAQSVTVVTTQPVIQTIPMTTTTRYLYIVICWSDTGTIFFYSSDGTNSVCHNSC